MNCETVLITGGARRVGRAIALACARAGASVAITYRTSADEAAELIGELNNIGSQTQRFAAFQADVSIASEVDSLAESVLRTFDSVTMLVNNAAIFRRTPFETLTEADFDDHIASNLKGPYLMSKKFGDIFMAQGRGNILNIADIYGIRPLQNYIPYCVSKAGLIMLTEAMAKALAPAIRVNCICPGTILLPSEAQDGDESENMGDESALLARIPMQRLGTPEEIAEASLFLLNGPQFITGAVLPVDGAQRLK